MFYCFCNVFTLYLFEFMYLYLFIILNSLYVLKKLMVQNNKFKNSNMLYPFYDLRVGRTPEVKTPPLTPIFGARITLYFIICKTVLLSGT